MIRKEMFDRITHEPVADLVVRQIEDMIVQGVLAEEARLPSERDLAQQFDVSRPRVRDALKTLEARGLLSIRHGEGTFVAKLSGQAMSPALIALFARHGLAFRDYLEYRREQEAFAARLAAERAAPSDLAAIERELSALEAADETGDVEASREADVRFHAAIVNASHNAMLIHMMTSIYDLTRRGVFYNRSFLRSLDGTGAKLLAQHREIARAVLASAPDAAEAAARAHLDFVERSYKVEQQKQANEARARKRGMASET